MSKLPSTGGLGEFMDDHEEKHAVGTGVGLGVAAAATGDLQMLAIVGVLVQQVFERKDRPAPAEKQDLANDIRREPHYFIAAVAVGAAIGAGVKALGGGL